MTEDEIRTEAVREIRAFVEKQDITCAETIYESDRVIVNAYDFIERLADIVGYKEEDEE